MITLAGAVAVGMLVALAALSRIDTGHSWWDWRDAPTVGWFLLVQYVLVAMLFAGVLGWFLPDDVRLVLIGVPAGFCVPPFVIGVRRWLTRGPRPAELEREQLVEEPERRRRPRLLDALITVAWAAPLGVVTGLVFGVRGADLLVLALLCPLLVLVNDAIRARLGRWARRHDLR